MYLFGKGSDTLKRKRHGGSIKGTIKRVFGKRKSDSFKDSDTDTSSIPSMGKDNDRRWKQK